MARILTFLLLVAGFIGARASPYGERDYEVADIMQKLLHYRDVCIEISGSDAGYVKFISSMCKAKECLMRHVDLHEFGQSLATTTVDNKKEFVDTYCPQFNASVGCFDNALEGMAMCMGGETSEIKQILSEIVSNIVQLFCKNDGAILFEVRKPEFRQCVNQLKEHASECKTSNVPKRTPISRFGEDECREFETAKRCVEDKLGSCSSSMDIVNVIYEPIFKANHCQKYTTMNEIPTNDMGVIQNV